MLRNDHFKAAMMLRIREKSALKKPRYFNRFMSTTGVSGNRWAQLPGLNNNAKRPLKYRSGTSWIRDFF